MPKNVTAALTSLRTEPMDEIQALTTFMLASVVDVLLTATARQSNAAG